MATVGSMTIAPGGLITGWAAFKYDTDGTIANKNSRQTVCVLADGALIGRAVAQQHNTSHDAGYDDEHGYSFQLPSALLDGTPHVIAVALQGGDGVFASQTGPLS
jgi:hypothetical protein